MRVFTGILSAVGIAALSLTGVVIMLVMFTQSSETEPEDTLPETGALSVPNDNRQFPARNANECVLPHAANAYPTDSLPLGGAPTGGLTWGWAIEEAGAGTTGRTIIFTPEQYGFSAVGLAPIALDARTPTSRVFSTLNGLVIDGAQDVREDKPGYGAFVEVRNSRYACVSTLDMWEINAPGLRAEVPGDPKLYYEGADVSPSVAEMIKCNPCGDNREACIVTMRCRHADDGEATEIIEGNPMCPSTACAVNNGGGWDLPAQEGDICEMTGVTQRPPDYPATRAIVDTLTADNFIGGKLPDLGYGKTGNYQIDLAHLAQNKIDPACSPGQPINNETYCGVIGTSGQDGQGNNIVLDEMLHYGGWDNPKATLDDPDTRWQSIDNFESFIGNSTEPGAPSIPAPCCPPLPTMAYRSVNSCGLVGIHGDNSAGIVQLVNHATTTLWGDYGLQITCNGSVIWDLPIVKIGLDPGEVMTWQQGQQPPVFYEGGDVGSCPAGGQMGLNITQLNSGDLPEGCQGAYAIPNEADAGLEDEALQKIKAAMAARERLCTPLSGIDHTNGDVREPIQKAFQCVDTLGSTKSCLSFASASNPESVDLLDYMAPTTGVTTKTSSGQQNSVERTAIDGRDGFIQHKNSDEESFSYSDDFIYLVKDTNWASGFNQNIHCTDGAQNEAAFTLLDGSFGSTDLCSVYASEQPTEAGQGGKWVPRRMAVGESFVSNSTLIGLDKVTGDCCQAPFTGERSHTIKLVNRGPVTTCSGLSFADVVQLMVTSGAGAGESFYYARGVGRIGWERRTGDPATGTIEDVSIVYEVSDPGGGAPISAGTVAFGTLNIEIYEDKDDFYGLADIVGDPDFSPIPGERNEIKPENRFAGTVTVSLYDAAAGQAEIIEIKGGSYQRTVARGEYVVNHLEIDSSVAGNEDYTTMRRHCYGCTTNVEITGAGDIQTIVLGVKKTTLP